MGNGSLSGNQFSGEHCPALQHPRRRGQSAGAKASFEPHRSDPAQQAYDYFGLSIAAYEIGAEVSSFTSKFDAYLAGTASLTAAELRGYNLFHGKGNCNTCHLDGRSNTRAPGGIDTGAATNAAPLFTDFTYNNIGLPMNLALPWYSENKPDQYGFTANPLGIGFIDEGVGLFLDGYYGSPPPNFDWIALNPFFVGKFQTSTVRNAAQMPPPTPSQQGLRKGVYAQWLSVEPEGGRAFLQHA